VPFLFETAADRPSLLRLAVAIPILNGITQRVIRQRFHQTDVHIQIEQLALKTGELILTASHIVKNEFLVFSVKPSFPVSAATRNPSAASPVKLVRPAANVGDGAVQIPHLAEALSQALVFRGILEPLRPIVEPKERASGVACYLLLVKGVYGGQCFPRYIRLVVKRNQLEKLWRLEIGVIDQIGVQHEALTKLRQKGPVYLWWFSVGKYDYPTPLADIAPKSIMYVFEVYIKRLEVLFGVNGAY
jgi:hypothetical protein